MTDKLRECAYSDSDKKRFEAKYIVNSDTGCWEWTGSLNGKRGYGKIYFNGRLQLAHRFSYEMHVGPIPNGLTIDHLCNNRRCVSPEHLSVATQYDNSMRGSSPPAENRRKTHCINGHPLQGEHIVIQRRRDGIRRRCNLCRPIYEQRRTNDGR